MISSAQCRGARGILNWTQAQLAEAAGVGVVTIRQFEAEKAEPRRATLKVIANALAAAGIEFTNGDAPGVRLVTRCEICRERATDITPDGGYDGVVLNCKGCGKYGVANNALSHMRSLTLDERRSALSIALGYQPLDAKYPEISTSCFRPPLWTAPTTSTRRSSRRRS